MHERIYYLGSKLLDNLKLTHHKEIDPIPVDSLEAIITQVTQNEKVAPTFRINAMPALFKTSDGERSAFDEEMKAAQPDGYIIGAGTGGIFALLKYFKEDRAPKGIIISDIDPTIIVAARIMIKELRAAKNYQDFARSFFFQSNRSYRHKVKKVLAQDSFLKKGLKEWDTWETPMEATKDLWLGNVPEKIQTHFSLLQHLALNHQLAACYSDVLNLKLIATICSLPNFLSLTNVIYLTNLLDYYPGFHQTEMPSEVKNLRLFDQSQKQPLFVSTPIVRDQELYVSRSSDELISLNKTFIPKS
ncbi:MAG TPA: hypothetical protein VD999_02830 [Vitreimonas sp.]|nr:hypothetical protein [Vitreimonas sp.]